MIAIRRTDRAPPMEGACAATEDSQYSWIEADERPGKASFAMPTPRATVMERTSSEARPVRLIATN